MPSQKLFRHWLPNRQHDVSRNASGKAMGFVAAIREILKRRVKGQTLARVSPRIGGALGAARDG